MYEVDTICYSIGAGFVLYNISGWISHYLCKGYRDLKPHQRAEWCSYVVSSIHALVVSITAIYLLTNDPDLRNNIVFASNPYGMKIMAVFFGYLIYDLIITIRHYKTLMSPSMLFHHVICITMTCFPLTDALQHTYLCPGCHFLINELSTPLLNHRYFLKTLGYGVTHPASVVTTLAFAVVFFFCRVVVNGYLLVRIFSQTSDIYSKVNTAAFVGVLFFPMVFFLLQAYWFASIVKRIVSTVRKSGGKKASSNKKVEVEGREHGSASIKND
eukprot:GEZU01043832.1.p2 GENE.GEZU01043832.1~~GEZU01043832.1.p2  ORF type:complete len:271 (+),score=60.72 GEZU01043832.1:186-998(+)